jgi:hypothetical protein
MTTAVAAEPTIRRVEVTDETITAYLADGRVISVPLAWSWRLSDATPAQRANWELIGDGHGIHWPDVDEDISAEGMLIGTPAPRPRNIARRTTPNQPVPRAPQPTSRVNRKGKPKRQSRAARG